MNFPEATLILPHKDPFLFISEITELVPSKSAEALWFIDGTEYFLKAIFPDAQHYRV